MGMYYEAYCAYGILVQRPGGVDFDMIESMDTGGTRENDLMRENNVGHLLAGNYDRDMLFLVTDSHSVDLGTYAIIDNESIRQFDYEGNNQRLKNVVDALGLEILSGPGWILVPDLS